MIEVTSPFGCVTKYIRFDGHTNTATGAVGTRDASN